MRFKSGSYTPLSPEDNGMEGNSSVRRSSKWRTRLSSGVIVGQGLLNFCLLVALLSAVSHIKSLDVADQDTCKDVLYSPAQEAVSYEVQFMSTKGQNKYMGEPGSPELDQAWEDMYNHIGVSQVHDSQAKFMPLPADSIPIAPEYHLLELSVFHELHCLNSLRKLIHQEQYPDLWPDGVDWEHVDHCVEVLRQSVTCSADISPMPWQFNAHANRSMPNPDIPHSCRSWDRITDWAKRNRFEERFAEFVLPG